ncbi:class I SAM-dependent methyltransferase [Macrococcus hajekii]|uniref:Class I SAM-dependent methyltransferase n=1 Tax=Macrococcus hajekii TaxID=198482 RepID=A0A4R6BJ66_9STAP|nr:class I SAM-dependent methyltransferase [Macrococcus hajekii]TDM01687.1 class I SAM-dependent methyltransferase [Macrococcus hajekii]GGB06594.1 methyltransferase [Macrococcus hajekii]
MDYTDIFTNKAALYERSRPSYPDELLNFLKQQFNIKEETCIADMGAGTGKLTEKLLDLGCRVIAVEPNQKMAERLRDGLLCNQLEVFERPAEHSEIDDKSVQLVVAAQSFHWFDWQLFRDECRRILMPCGQVCLIWNVKDEDALINRRTEDIIKAYCPDYIGNSNGITSNDDTIRQFFDGDFELFEAQNDLSYGLQCFIERALSSSYAPEEDAPEYESFKAALTSLFETFAEDGMVIVPNTTRCYYGKV